MAAKALPLNCWTALHTERLEASYPSRHLEYGHGQCPLTLWAKLTGNKSPHQQSQCPSQTQTERQSQTEPYTAVEPCPWPKGIPFAFNPKWRLEAFFLLLCCSVPSPGDRPGTEPWPGSATIMAKRVCPINTGSPGREAALSSPLRHQASLPLQTVPLPT